ncbi:MULTISPECIES: M20 family metallopeptidase [Thiomicrorhabdus]|uniref:M20 family metallopeptidase n=1 Tax=Thiomicrorhabdus heinhorstiae TaxID=2748010 RepID=A0ABS0BU09_9GAMM|nr:MULTISPECIES: M20 family metallopeptidase [Thiomicrorhabdus]MBF6057328.1 M20 family metallopeptidase [Thiomicrorhabdus heinhorstiae]
MGYLQDLEKIILINSYTKNKVGVDQVGSLFDEWLQPLGFTVTRFPREQIGDHRYYRSQNKSGKKLLLLGHLDTVFPPQKFETFYQDEQWVYGPGVCDMKGGNMVFLQALRSLHEKGIEIGNIDVLLVSDEETGSDDSKHLSAELAKDYDYCLVYEAAGVKGEVVTARKGVGTFTIDINGVARHAGNHYADGVDANLEAAYKLQALVLLTDLAKGTTVNVGKMEGGIGANTISPHAHLLFELRYTSEQERDRVLTAIEQIVQTSYVKGTTATLGGGIQRDVMQSSQATMQWIEAIEEITGTRLSYEERGGVSDANILSSAGVLTLDGLGPFGDGDHTVNERASKTSFVERIALSTNLFEHFIRHGDFQ